MNIPYIENNRYAIYGDQEQGAPSMGSVKRDIEQENPSMGSAKHDSAYVLM